MDSTANALRFVVCDSLEKVFTDEEPRPLNRTIGYSVFLGEPASFQVAFFSPTDIEHGRLSFEIDSASAPYVTMYEVKAMPCRIAAQENHGEGYLRTKPGLYPDLLRPLIPTDIYVAEQEWQSIWVDFCVENARDAGIHVVTLTALLDGIPLHEETLAIEVFPRTLPELDLVNCHWLHADSLADYYHFNTFDEAHWHAIENYVESASHMQVNAILTPTWTPPLDTAKDRYRTPTQLIDIRREGESYSFDFTKLIRWMDICRRHGIRYLEVAHLFSQWGAESTPAIYAIVEGSYQRIFGWNTPATDPEYAHFLHALIPQLLALFADHWSTDRVLFHISDEPHGPEHRITYSKARDVVKDLLRGCRIVDALSDYEFYRAGLVDIPIAANDAIEPFIQGKVSPLWTYYCVAQRRDVSNRFVALPSARNRVIGHQLFTGHMQGFLHWGYNFYYSELSDHLIDPFEDLTSDGAFPAGDPFIVYPGPDSIPWPSLRYKVFAQAMWDYRSMQLLAELQGRQTVLKIIDPDGKLTFRSFSEDPDHYRQKRELINRQIMNN